MEEQLDLWQVPGMAIGVVDGDDMYSAVSPPHITSQTTIDNCRAMAMQNCQIRRPHYQHYGW